MEPLNTYRSGPDETGHFGLFGGRFVAETLMPLILAVEQAYEQAKADPSFQAAIDHYAKHYVGRPSPLYFAERITQRFGGAKIYFKRDELNHTGAHKINNCMGQILLARRMGKTRIIAETGAGQHGGAQCLPHETPGRRSGAGKERLAHPEGRHERGAQGLGGERREHLLHHRHGGGPAPLPRHGA
jgi:hypothetical protein